MGREGEIEKMASGDRNISCVGQEKRMEKGERKVGLVMTQKEIGRKQIGGTGRWNEISGIEIKGTKRQMRHIDTR